jgi:hypothetical protein
MIALVLAAINMGVFHLGAYKRIGEWNDALPPPAAARISGAISLVLWIAVIFLGRWIGYTVQ